MNHAERIKALIDKAFADTSVPPEKTMETMEEVRGHCEMLIEALKEDGDLSE